jgi:hypothetical protein
MTLPTSNPTQSLALQARKLAVMHNIYTIEDLQRHYKQKTGGHWFDAATINFFQSKFSSQLYFTDSQIFFVSSERNTMPHADKVRRYSIRVYEPKTGYIATCGEFGEFATIKRAQIEAKHLAYGKKEKLKTT